MSWEPELEELRRREALAREMGGEERVERQHARGRLTVRERIERLFDPGTFHETGALAGRRRTYEDGELADFTAREHGRRPGRDRRPRGRRPGRRLHRPRRRRRRRDLAEDGLRRAAGARPAAAARAARRRHRRRRLGQVARADGLHLRAVHPRAWSWPSRTCRACRWSPRRSARWPGSAPRASWPRTSRDRARHRAAVRGRPAGGRRRDGRVARQGGARRRRARRRAPAPSTTRRPTRTTRSTSCGASSPTCRRACGSCRRSRRATRPAPTGARRSCCRSSRATRASPTTCARILERGARPRLACSSSARATAAR